MYISVQLINWGGDHSNLNFHSFGPKFLIHFCYSWHLRKKNIFFQGLDDLPEIVKRFFTWPLCTFRERTTNKVPISDYTVIYLYSYCLDKFCFFVGVIKFLQMFWNLTRSFVLISIIQKLFSINFALF